MFVDLEGDPFVGENGLQYLLGLRCSMCRRIELRKAMALNREEEKKGFEWLVDEIMRRREAKSEDARYHFGANEPGALKRLMGMYATREDQIDRLLARGYGRFASGLQARRSSERGGVFAKKSGSV